MYAGTHILSVNLEDYFQVAPMRKIIPSRNWPKFELRVERSTEEVLSLLEKHQQTATFFVLGWIAERRPDIIAEIARRGHTVASKGYLHRAFKEMSLDEFESDLNRSLNAIGNATGETVRGYRIAEGQLPVDDLRPFEVLARAGIAYDSSVRPFGLSFIGKSEWQRRRTLSGPGWSIEEVPLTAHSVFGVPVPMTGGNYLRQAPEALYDRQLSQYLATADAPWHLYFHNWELDTKQPRVSATSRMGHIRQYRNLENMPARLDKILGAHRFTSIEENLGLKSRAFVPAVAAQTAEIKVAARSAAVVKPVTIVVPCYNEEATLPYLAANLAAFAAENRDTLKLSYVFVDDGSADRTYDKLNELFGSRADCTVVKHAKNRGITAATMTGIRQSNDEIVCGIDCDCSFDPHELANMIPLLTADVDMVQASPYHAKGGVVNVPWWRLALSRNLSRVYNVILNHRFASYTACFRVYRRSAVAPLDVTNNGFMGIMEMFILLDKGGSKIVEYPAVLETRLIGFSKMKTLSVIRSHIGMIAELVFKPDGVKSRAGGRGVRSEKATAEKGI